MLYDFALLSELAQHTVPLQLVGMCHVVLWNRDIQTVILYDQGHQEMFAKHRTDVYQESAGIAK